MWDMLQTERARRQQAEFMHTKDMHAELEHYEARLKRMQLDRYKRAIWQATHTNDSPIFMATIDISFTTTRERYNGGNALTSAGTYGRINDTFVVHLENQPMIDELRNHIASNGYDRLSRISQEIRRNYVHDTRNSIRNENLCESHSYWAVDRYTEVSFVYDRLQLVCLGCGVSGGLSI
jgi:hypothetical protein